MPDAPDTSIQELKTCLEKKATFETGLTGLLRLAAEGNRAAVAPTKELVTAALRAIALLKARYSNPGWLRTGARLLAALLLHTPADAAQRTKLETAADDVRALLGDEGDGNEEGAPRAGAAAAEPTLGELLGFAPRPAPRPPQHLTDAGLVIDGPAAAAAAAPGVGNAADGGNGQAQQLLQLILGATQGAEQQQQEQQQRPATATGGGNEAASSSGGGSARSDEGHEEGGDDGARTPNVPELADLAGLRALLARLQAHNGGDGDGGGNGGGDGSGNGGGGTDDNSAAAHQQHPPNPAAAALGRMSAEDLLDALQMMLATAASDALGSVPAPAPSRPPASRRLVASLPVDVVDAAAEQAAAAAGDSCPICCCEYRAGDKRQRLPCGHAFHPACNAPWLAQHNTCALCREELPTDDHAYEARREREKQEAEDARGAAAAHSHNEFMYT